MKDPDLVCLNDVEEGELLWLWYPYIPAGYLTQVFGIGGVGKSALACYIAAQVTTGRPLPGQDNPLPAQSVLILAAEDDAGVVLKPRLRKMGADLNKIYVSSHTFTLDNKAGLHKIHEQMCQSAATICFVDPIASWLGPSVDINKVNQVRGILGPLSASARQTGCAVVVVHHPGKGFKDDPKHGAAGSVDFNNAPRSNIEIKANTDGQSSSLIHRKSNFGVIGPDLCFTYDGEQLEWLAQGNWAAAKPKASASSFLRTILATGPVPALEVRKLADDAGLSWTTVVRVKEGIAHSVNRPIEGKAHWYWEINSGEKNG